VEATLSGRMGRWRHRGLLEDGHVMPSGLTGGWGHGVGVTEAEHRRGSVRGQAQSTSRVAVGGQR
jgi:hypothetical protein